MPAPVFRRYEQILQSLISMVVSRTALTDVTDASVFKHILAATARELDEAYYQMGLLPDLFSLDTAVGDDLDARAAEIQPALIQRLSATKSVGQVQFARTGTAGTVTVPAGTVVQTASGIQFVTTADGTIANLASSSGDVPAVAVEGGAEGNVVAGAVLRFESKPPGVDTVGNAAPFVGGADAELDDAFRARIKQFIATLARSTVEALEFVALGATVSSGARVRFAHVFEDPINRGEVTLYVDDGSGTAELSELIVGENLCEGLAGPPPDSAVGGEEFLWTNFRPIKTSAGYTFTSSTRGALVDGVDYVLDDAAGRLKSLPALVAGEVVTGTYTAYDGLVREVQKLVDGDANDRENYPGWRAAGVRVRVTVPTVLQQTVVASVLVAEGFVKATVLEEARAAVLDYINNLGISGDVLRAELIERIMGVAGVVNVSLTSPAADVILLDDQLPRALTANVLLS